MEPQEIQSGLPEQSTYFDPDAPDVSEQQFSASLEVQIEKPSFVVDDPTVRSEEQPSISPFVPCEEHLPEPPEIGESTFDAPEADLPTTGENWRDQVSAKVNYYKSRKAPKVRYPSLQLQFEPPPARVRSSVEIEREREFVQDAVPENDPQPRQVPVFLEATARVIEFPRPAGAPPRLDGLAE